MSQASRNLHQEIHIVLALSKTSASRCQALLNVALSYFVMSCLNVQGHLQVLQLPIAAMWYVLPSCWIAACFTTASLLTEFASGSTAVTLVACELWSPACIA